MNPIVEKVYQIGIIPVIAFNSVDESRFARAGDHGAEPPG